MSIDAVLERVDRETGASLEQLKEYLRIPSVSTDPAYAGEIRRCAGFVRERLESAGLEARSSKRRAIRWSTASGWGRPGGRPSSFTATTDVQPVDPLDEWRNDPFEPTIETGERGDRIVARGATDDKGQSFTHIKAVEALMAETGSLPVNVKFLIEGEEECGGEAIEAYVRSPAAERLACDLALVSDTSMYGPGQPSVLYGLKGLLYTEVRVRGAARDLHSGTFGGAVANPLNALGTMLAALRDPEDGRILIPGFYDDVQPLGAGESAAFAALPFDETKYGDEIGATALWGEAGLHDSGESLGSSDLRCERDVGRLPGAGRKDGDRQQGRRQGVHAPRSRPGTGTSLPRVRGVHAFDGASGHRRRGGEPERGPAGSRRPRRTAGRRGARGHPGGLGPGARAGPGGQGRFPSSRPCRRCSEHPVLLVGFGLSDDRLHAPNEKMDLANFYQGIRTVVRVLDRLGGCAVDSVHAVA